MDTKKIEAAVAQIIEAVREDGSREGLQETPQRIAKMYQEIFAGLGETAEEHLAKSFEIIDNNMVVEKDIFFHSMCEHHFLPFYGKVHDERSLGSAGTGRLPDADSSSDDWNIVRTKQVAASGNKQVHQVYQELTSIEMKAQGEAYKNPFKGTTAGDAAVAIGVAALAEGALSTAFGSGTSASGVGAAAFGVGATASQNKSVAIGAGSHTNTDATAVTTATVNGITYGGFAGTTHITPGSQVSFGSAGFERQLKHVAKHSSLTVFFFIYFFNKIIFCTFSPSLNLYLAYY